MSLSKKRCMMQASKLILVNCIRRGMTAENIAFNRALVPHIKPNYQSAEEKGFKRVFDESEYSNFSYVFHKNGMWRDVEDLEYEIVEMMMKKQGITHPLTLTSMSNLAVAHSYQGKYEEAVELELKVVDLYKTVLGPEHPDTLTVMANLARASVEQG